MVVALRPATQGTAGARIVAFSRDRTGLLWRKRSEAFHLAE